MTYFKLTESTDLKIIGPHFPQCQSFIRGYDNSYENERSLYHFAHFKGKKISFKPDLSSIQTGQKTRMTDLLSCPLGPGNDKVVSDEFIKILKNFTTSHLQVYSCTINKKSESFYYHWIHFIYNLEKVIDFEKTIFTHPEKKKFNLIEEIKDFNSYSLFRKKYDKHDLLTAKKTYIKHKPLDFFVIGNFNQNCYVSHALKSELICLTGLEFTEDKSIYFLQP